MADRTVRWTPPVLNETCITTSRPEVASCFGKGKCGSSGACSCYHKYGDAYSFCEHSIFDYYTDGAKAFPIIGIVLTSVIAVLFILELCVEVRLGRFAAFKTPMGIAKMIMIPYLILQIIDFGIFLDDFGRAELSPEIFESVVDALSQILVFFVITMLAVGWYGMLMRSKRLKKKFPLKKTRWAIIGIFAVYAILWVVLSILEGLDVVDFDSADLTAAIYIVIFNGILSVSLVKLSRWIHEKTEEKSKRFAKVQQRNRFLVATLVCFALLALSLFVSGYIPNRNLPYVKLVIKSIDEAFFIALGFCLFLFSQNYMFAVGFLGAYVRVSQISSTQSGLSGSTGSSGSTAASKRKGSSIASTNSNGSTSVASSTMSLSSTDAKATNEENKDAPKDSDQAASTV